VAPQPSAPAPSANSLVAPQLESFLGLILGTTPACTAAIIDSVSVLIKDVAGVYDASSGPEGAPLRSPLETLIRDLIIIAMKLPPLCLAEESAVALLSQAFEIVQLAHGTSSDDILQGPSPAAAPPHVLPGEVDNALELGPSGEVLELAQAIQALPGVGSELDDDFAIQIAQTLKAASKEDPVTLAQIIVALLPDEALDVLDKALNQSTLALPGAKFVNTINDLEGVVGIDVIPDAILEGPVINLIIRSIGLVGALDKESEKVLMELADSLRDAVATGRSQTAFQRAELLGRIVVRQSEKPDSAVPAPLNESYQQELNRMKVLAGIR